MPEDTHIASVMQTDFLRLSETMPIREAIAALLDAGASAAPVTDPTGSLVGVLTQKDCFRSALNASYYQQWRGAVGDFMSKEPATLEAETDFVTAAEAFIEKPYRAYPVTDAGTLVGMLHRSDLLAAFLKHG
ncbi:CBS domain-containing protein [Pseudoruegeria sp. HB172150]|uniref:CBS domain-containing protein n=1 Tax=Pseudoruegeria sp. HB172150 TaxID=2721164 RepID=UPI0015577ADF|nr:CBS domain-containing protein [Pseudoruegeria sp. HB172150]